MAKRTVIIDGAEMTFHEAHQDLWNWLSQHPGKEKEDYFLTHIVKSMPRNLCFACESCIRRCKSCPIVRWRDCAKTYDDIFPCNYYMLPDGDGHNELYGEWINLMRGSHFDEACKVAKQIADLEWEEVAE